MPKSQRVSGKLIVKEVGLYTNDENRLIIAREMIFGSLKNISSVIKYYERRKQIDAKFELDIFLNKINNVKNINSLMLVEAEARKSYYYSFSKILELDNFKRVTRGAKDLINILLNFINSLLYSLVFSEIMKTNISGMIGIIHEVDNDRYPLIYDISDIFKPILVDRLIFRLINRKQLNNSHVDDGILSNSAIKIIFKEWNIQINEKIYSNNLKRYVNYRYLIREELYKLERYLMKDIKYKSFISRW